MIQKRTTDWQWLLQVLYLRETIGMSLQFIWAMSIQCSTMWKAKTTNHGRIFLPGLCLMNECSRQKEKDDLLIRITAGYDQKRLAAAFARCTWTFERICGGTGYMRLKVFTQTTAQDSVLLCGELIKKIITPPSWLCTTRSSLALQGTPAVYLRLMSPWSFCTSRTVNPKSRNCQIWWSMSAYACKSLSYRVLNRKRPLYWSSI